MNFFSSKPKQGGSLSAAETEQQVVEKMQKLEIEMMTDMYTKLSDTCRTKCIPLEMKEPELTKGEANCLDRCVAKYMELHDAVGKLLQEKTNPGGDPAAVPTPPSTG